MSRSHARSDPLRELARSCGVQLGYRDATGRPRRASRETLVAVLGALGVPVDREADAAKALRIRSERHWARVVEPVVVAWNGGPAELRLRLPAASAVRPVPFRISRETGEELRSSWDPTALPVAGTSGSHVELRATLPGGLPLGYHRLEVDPTGPAGLTCSTVISAPIRAPSPAQRSWGVFLPLYALRSERDWGVGDLTDLEALARWAADAGAGFVATLPLLAASLDEPFEPGPYDPASRLFWNELYVDVTRAPGLERVPESRAAIDDPRTRATIDRFRHGDLVDLRGAMALKRSVLEPLAAAFFAEPGIGDREAFDRFERATPALEAYARFAAARDRFRAPWWAWPAPMRDGAIDERDADPDRVRYHRYVQWVAASQLEAVAGSARARGVGLHLDVPVGVSRSSFDVWRDRDAFALEAGGGAPPDPFAAEGQDWGFPPLHPERIREDGYRYPIACLRHVLRFASAVRIDHVMGLHRLYWVPRGMDARDGAYVRYRSEELSAIVTLEAERAGAVVVGEDLGTVPAAVRRAMGRHGLHRTYVLGFALTVRPEETPMAVPERSFAAIETHDMAPFAAYWSGADIDERVALGVLDPEAAERERADRAALRVALLASPALARWLPDAEDPDPAEVLGACLRYLAASPARAVIVNLEDLWGETRFQNLPPAGDRYPSWRRRARYPVEAFGRLPGVLDTLEAMDRLRKGHA